MSTITAPLASLAPGRRSTFLVSPLADSVLLIGSPLLALAFTATVFGLMGGRAGLAAAGGVDATVVGFAIGTLVAAHLVVTFVHTHGNPAVFRAHPWRFTAVPVALLVTLAAFPALRVLAVAVAVVWDVHHSGMQTFGLARLYARKAGNDAGAGRALDLALNHVLYAGPILAGAGLLIHLGSMDLSGAIPAWQSFLGSDAVGNAPWLQALRWCVIAGGLGVIVVHGVGHWRLARRGVPVSPLAIVLLAATGVTSIVSWGLNPFGMALVTMKLFHCVQYFTLVALVEREQIAGLVGRAGRRLSLPAVAGILLVPCLAYGAWARLQLDLFRSGLALSLILTVTLMHFWYDGFTWSVRRPRT